MGMADAAVTREFTLANRELGWAVELQINRGRLTVRRRNKFFENTRDLKVGIQLDGIYSFGFDCSF